MKTQGLQTSGYWNQRFKINTEFFSICLFLQNKDLESTHKSKGNHIIQESNRFLSLKKRIIENL